MGVGGNGALETEHPKQALLEEGHVMILDSSESWSYSSSSFMAQQSEAFGPFSESIDIQDFLNSAKILESGESLVDLSATRWRQH